MADYVMNTDGKYGSYIVQTLQAPQFSPGFAEFYATYAKRLLWMDNKVVPGAFQMNTAWYLSASDVRPLLKHDEHVHEHDEMIAFLSQLTHCIAVSLMCSSDDPTISRYTGDSFRDLTRIAKINDEMWSELFIANKEKLLFEMDNFLENFKALRDALEREDRDKMREMMRTSTERREAFDKK